MFTIKHVATDGNEELHYGSNPKYISLGSLEGRERGNSVVNYTDVKGDKHTIRWGKVYIMNDSGKTVSTYDLGSPNVGSTNELPPIKYGGTGYKNPPIFS